MVGVGGHPYRVGQDKIVTVDDLWKWYGSMALEATNPKWRFCLHFKLDYTGGPRPSSSCITGEVVGSMTVAFPSDWA